jgi:tetratricopeptide (TPR) repeat protein
LLLGENMAGERSLAIALDVASECGFPAVEVGTHLEFGRHYMEAGKANLVSAHLSQARALVAINKDPRLELEVLEARAVFAHHQRRSDDARVLWEEILTHEGLDDDALVRGLIGLANCHLRSGRLDEAEPLLQRAWRTTRRTGDRLAEGRVLNNLGILHAFLGHSEEAMKHFRRALSVRENLGYMRGVVVNLHNIGDVHFAQEEYAKAYVSFRRSQEHAQRMDWRLGSILNEVFLFYIDGLRDPLTDALPKLEQVVVEARTLGDIDIALTGGWLMGRLLASRGETDAASERLKAALQEAEDVGQIRLGAAIRETLESVQASAKAAPVSETPDLPDDASKTPQ